MNTATDCTEIANDNGSLAACLDVAEEIAVQLEAEDRVAEQDRLAANALTHYVGSKNVRGRDTRETAALIRKELVAAGKASTGVLAGCTFQVKIDRSSMSSSIDVRILSIPARGASIINGRWVEQEDSRKIVEGRRQSILSKRGTALISTVEAIVTQYNFDKSDIGTDYYHSDFYSGVSFGPGIESAAIAEIRAALALLKQA